MKLTRTVTVKQVSREVRLAEGGTIPETANAAFQAALEATSPSVDLPESAPTTFTMTVALPAPSGYSKKWENLDAALALHFAYYNFCRIHRSIRVTPAMEAGIANHVWDIAELLA